MSNLIPSVIPLRDGLDLSTAKLLADPGSLSDCLNIEVVDVLGYRRIDGYSRYDGNVIATDIGNLQARTGRVTITFGTPPAFDSNFFAYDADGNIVGFVFDFESDFDGDHGDMTYMMFTGSSTVTSAEVAGSSWGFKGITSEHSVTTITQAQLIALEASLRNLVAPLPYTPCGLHWSQRHLFAVVPLLIIPYMASTANQTVAFTTNATITNTFSAATAILLDKIVTQPAGVADVEEGYLIASPLDTFSWSVPTAATYTLGGAVSVGVGTVYLELGAAADDTSVAASVWRAQRPATYNFSKVYAPPGWNQLTATYTARVTLTQAQVPFSVLHRNASTAEATYYFSDGVIPTALEFIMLDYFVVSGSFDGGDAVVDIQFAWPGADITDAFTVYADSAATVDLAEVTVRMAYNALPSFPQLKEHSSRYQFKTANFYATEGTAAIYGVNGAGRAFVIGPNNLLTLIHTQDDEALDIPRHVENHLLHLALGFKPGSVQLSVVGQPTNFDGLEGASEHGVGDSLTGLMSLNGTTLGVFCSNSIWSITGSIVDNFQLQVISPKTGCIEYTLASCGEPYYLDSRGICTLSTSANYGDFVGARLSDKVSAWLRPRLRQNVVGLNNAAGVTCAFPVREKNQYRIHFNDGRVLTTTLRETQGTPAFTWQKLYLEQTDLAEDGDAIVPFAWTSEVDEDGKERIFVAHYNTDMATTSNEVFALECGNSFDGTYIPNFFTVNWHFTQNPVQFQTLQAVRLYGLSKGIASLKVQAAGIQNDMYFTGASLSTTLAEINLPRVPTTIAADFKDATNRTDIIARGLATQLRFSGSITNIAVIEPSYYAQVLITFTSPDGAFDL